MKVLSCVLALAGVLVAVGDAKVGVAEFAPCERRFEKLMDQVLPKAARRMADGTRVYNPDAGQQYNATWLRDFAYMAESGRVPTEDVVNEALLFLRSVSPQDEGVDCVWHDGRPCYKPGGGRMGEKPVADGCPFTVSVAYLAWRQSGDDRFVRSPVLDTLVRVFDATPSDPDGSGLVWIDPKAAHERCPYGFTDTMRKTGKCLFTSLLKYEAGRRLERMLLAAGRGETARRIRQVCDRVRESVNATFWDESAGLYRAATVKCREHDVWGSAFAVWLDVAPVDRADRIAGVFRRAYAGLVHAGQVRHLMPGVYWEDARLVEGEPLPRDVYQNGAFWGTPTGWFAWTLARVDRALALRTFEDLATDYEKGGVCECHYAAPGPCPWKATRPCSGGYPANLGLPLAALRRFRLEGCRAVPRPWTPVTVSGTDVSVWGRTYSFASNALPVGVKALGSELLAAPVRVVVDDAEGKPVSWKKGGSWVQERDAESATVCAWQEAETVTADATHRIEFDGLSKVSLALVPGPKSNLSKVRRAWLEIPLRPERATLYVVSPASWTKLDNVGAVKGPLKWPFRCSVWVGDEKAGYCWFCESDENLAQGDDTVEIVPGERDTVLRIRLADGETELPQTWTFGLQATPVKAWNAAHNADHTLHSPQMGVGITIRRPEVWWTSQRAFPNGHMEERLDEAAARGVKTVAFHEDWIPLQNNPAPRPDFKGIVRVCHARGLKAIAYQGYELSPLDPLWGDLQATCLSKDETGRNTSYWFREPGQRDYRVCYASAFSGAWLKRAKAAYEELGLDGFYLDGTIMPRACANERHGCGWRDAKGKLHVTYPFFAVRKMMRELYEFVDARGGRIDAHQSGYVCPATLAFVHSYWDGEQLACSKQDIKRTLDLAAFRAEFMGVNHGVPCEFLAYEVPGKWSYDDALAITLLHNVLVRPCGFGAEARLQPLWQALDGFGIVRAEWLPYWENPLVTSPASVKASVYRHGGKSLAVVSNVSPDAAVEARVTLPTGVTQAVDALTGRAVDVRNGQAVFGLEPFRMRLLRY